MLKLKFNLRHQDIQLVNKGTVVATDSKYYLVAKFNTVSDDWETPLTAVFTDDKHKQPYAVIVGADARLAENECFVPWEVLTDAANVYVSVYCGNLHTTITAAFKVRKSGYIEGETPPPPSPTVYDTIMRAITDLQVGKQDKLTAGDNITIDENGVISAEGGGSEIVSGVVNQNGTITFTDSGGNIFTTTGESVIGPQGIQGATGPQGPQGDTGATGPQGEKGDKGDKGDTGAAGAQGEQGVKGDPGATGADGFSPTATVTQTQSGATVTITDKSGTTTANISNGAPGQDYVLTAQDKDDIADIVLAEFTGSIVNGELSTR